MNIYGILNSYQNIKNINYYTKQLEKNNEKLSTGKRVSRASDDPSAVLRINKLESNARGNIVAQRNIIDGMNLLSTAEGSLNTAVEITHRLKELSVQYKSETISIEEKSLIEEETKVLLEEMASVLNKTEYNGKNILRENILIKTGYKQGDSLVLDTKLIQGVGVDINLKDNSHSKEDSKRSSVKVIPMELAYKNAKKAYSDQSKSVENNSEVKSHNSSKRVCDINSNNITQVYDRYKVSMFVGGRVGNINGQISLDVGHIEKILEAHGSGKGIDKSLKHSIYIDDGEKFHRGEFYFDSLKGGSFAIEIPINGRVKSISGKFTLNTNISNGKINGEGYIEVNGRYKNFTSKYIDSMVVRSEGDCKPDKGKESENKEPTVPIEKPVDVNPNPPSKKPTGDEALSLSDILTSNYGDESIKSFLNDEKCGVNNLLESLSSKQSKIGVKYNVLEYRLMNLRNTEVHQNEEMANIKDLDMARELMAKVKNEMLLNINTKLLSSNLDKQREHIYQLIM